MTNEDCTERDEVLIMFPRLKYHGSGKVQYLDDMEKAAEVLERNGYKEEDSKSNINNTESRIKYYKKEKSIRVCISDSCDFIHDELEKFCQAAIIGRDNKKLKTIILTRNHTDCYLGSLYSKIKNNSTIKSINNFRIIVITTEPPYIKSSPRDKHQIQVERLYIPKLGINKISQNQLTNKNSFIRLIEESTRTYSIFFFSDNESDFKTIPQEIRISIPNISVHMANINSSSDLEKFRKNSTNSLAIILCQWKNRNIDSQKIINLKYFINNQKAHIIRIKDKGDLEKINTEDSIKLTIENAISFHRKESSERSKKITKELKEIKIEQFIDQVITLNTDFNSDRILAEICYFCYNMLNLFTATGSIDPIEGTLFLQKIRLEEQASQLVININNPSIDYLYITEHIKEFKNSQHNLYQKT